MTPVFSPDGNWIAYQTGHGGKWGLAKKVASGGGKPVQLRPEDGRLLRAQWSPDGNWLTWLSSDGLTILSADGNRSELLSDETGWQQTAGFSKDGSEVVGIRENESHHYVVEAIHVASKRKRIILDMGPQFGTHGFSLAPDGKSFLTTLARYHGDIWMLEGFPQP
jgi:Tol biopolymer transport system component